MCFLFFVFSSLPTEEILDKWNLEDFWKETITKIRINPLNCINWSNGNMNAINNRGAALLKIFHSKSPIIIATDGGHETLSKNIAASSASISICIIDIKDNESIMSRESENREIIPVLIRSCRAHSSDNNQGEALALCMQEEILPLELSRCVIMDSAVVRSIFLTLRSCDSIKNRVKFRNIFPGVGKGIISRLNSAVQVWKSWDSYKCALDDEYPQACITKCAELNDRHKDLMELISTWRQEDAIVSDLWKKEYLDTHNFRSVLKIDSHQLDPNGSGIIIIITH